jgi:hypothetical protein
MDHVEKQTRAQVRLWLQTVMLDRGWSAEEWARRADTSATNITRPLSPGSKILPTVLTVARLARVAGSQPDLLAPVTPRIIQPGLRQPDLQEDRRSPERDSSDARSAAHP